MKYFTLPLLLLITACNTAVDLTTVKGTITTDDPSIVINYYIMKAGELCNYSKEVPVENGTFDTTIPVCTLELASVEYRNASCTRFVSDGSIITINADEGYAVSSDPEGLHSRFITCMGDLSSNAISSEAVVILKENGRPFSEFRAVCDSLYVNIAKRIISENPDNAIGSEVKDMLERYRE